MDSIPWEYAYGPDGYIILECHFVRGLPEDERIPTLKLDGCLHIVAVPSNPLNSKLRQLNLNIEGEWLRIRETIYTVPFECTLARTRPPTVEQMHRLLINQHQRVVHFMGHARQLKTRTELCFEKENGDLDWITARQFVMRLRGTVFLVTLNACVSASPGPTAFSNVAAALVRQKVPYALGMRFTIYDSDARIFSRTFYGDLASNVPIEEALLQARLSLADSRHQWVIGAPVLYTALATPTAGFTSVAGKPQIDEHQPLKDLSAIPHAEGAFQGRIDELKQLGNDLTGDSRPKIITIHGGGGQGKTTLVYRAIERFACAWPDGVWAATLENLPSRTVLVNDLARFLGINTQNVPEPSNLERIVQTKLASSHMLIILDNAETLIEGMENNDASAYSLVEFLQQLPSSSVSLLVTSRIQLGWIGEKAQELGGLSPKEGAALFQQSAPQRIQEIDPILAETLSQKLEGHPFGLRLLGGAFNASNIPLQAFVREYNAQLRKAENKNVETKHRQRTLRACIGTSVRYLDANLRALLSGLWVFRAPFLTQSAVAIFDPDCQDTEENPSLIQNYLYTLWKHGLLTREKVMIQDDNLQFYYLLPTTRLFVEHDLEQAYKRDELLARFGAVYAQRARILFEELDKHATAAVVAQKTRDDLEQGIANVVGIELGYYLLHWGWILQRLGDRQRGLELLERALEIAQGQDRRLEAQSIYNIATIYQVMGQWQRALDLYQQALPMHSEIGDRGGEAATMNGLASIYQIMRQPQAAITLYQQALPITREVGDRACEADTLNGLASVYNTMGHWQQALNFYQQALPIRREVSDLTGEADTLNGMAHLYQETKNYEEGLSAFEESIVLERQVTHYAGEAVGLVGKGRLLYEHLNRIAESITYIEQAIRILEKTGLAQDAAGHTVDNLLRTLRVMQKGELLSPDRPIIMSPTEIQQIVTSTVSVMTTMQERRKEWHEIVTQKSLGAQQQGADGQIEVSFFTTVLDVLDGHLPTLATDHPYAHIVETIQKGIDEWDSHDDDHQMDSSGGI